MSRPVAEKIYISSEKRKSASLYLPLVAGCRLLNVHFVTSLKSNVCAAVTVQNGTGDDSIRSHAQDTIAGRPCVFLTEILSLLVINF
jgi:hypothetical protein